MVSKLKALMPLRLFDEEAARACIDPLIVNKAMDYTAGTRAPLIANFELNYGRLMHSPELVVDWVLAFDSVSLIASFTILTISGLVHVYSIEYMRTDPHVVRFFGYLSLFTFFMLVLVNSGNLLIFYIG